MATLDPCEEVRRVAGRLTTSESGVEFSTLALRKIAGGIAAHYGEKGFEQFGTLDQWLDPDDFDPRDEAPLGIAREIVLAIDYATEGQSVSVEECIAVVREVIEDEIDGREAPD